MGVSVLAQGALANSNENAGIPQWAMGCRNVGCRNPQISSDPCRILQYGNSLFSNKLRYQVFCFEDIKYFGYKPALTKNIVKAALNPNYEISSKQKTWYLKLLLNAEFPYCRIQEGSVGFLGFGDSDIPQPTVGFPPFRLNSRGPPVAQLFKYVLRYILNGCL